jgi:hypothetical protein
VAGSVGTVVVVGCNGCKVWLGFGWLRWDVLCVICPTACPGYEGWCVEGWGRWE